MGFSELHKVFHKKNLQHLQKPSAHGRAKLSLSEWALRKAATPSYSNAKSFSGAPDDGPGEVLESEFKKSIYYS